MKVQMAEHVIWRDLGDEVVILSLANNNYFGLVGAGGQMWRYLAENGSIDRTVEALATEFDTDVATLRSDLEVLVRELEALGLVVVDSGTATTLTVAAQTKAPKRARIKRTPRHAGKPRAAKPARGRKMVWKKRAAKKRPAKKSPSRKSRL